jgi:hypothetical protein
MHCFPARAILAVGLCSSILLGPSPVVSGYVTVSPSRNHRRSTPLWSTSSCNENPSVLRSLQPPSDGPRTGVSARTARIISPFFGALTILLEPGSALAESDPETFEASLQVYFPGSLESKVVSQRVSEALKKRNYSPTTMILGSSLCSDEINSYPDSLIAQLATTFVDPTSGGVFALGGLGGLPFVGTSGMGAFVSHAPESGKVLIVFGPHVGISQTGTVGKVERIGQKSVSTSCGAAIGAYKAVAAKKKLIKGGNGMDFEEEYIIEKIEPRLEMLSVLEPGDDTTTFVTTQMFDIIYELLRSQVDGVTAKEKFWEKISEITLLGGIVINRGRGREIDQGQDYFQPLLMRSITENGESNMFKEVFGDLPLPRSYQFLTGPPDPSLFNKAIQTYFPGAQQNSAIASRVLKALRARDYGENQVLMGSSLCADEINYTPESLVTLLSQSLLDKKYGGVFNLGGLGGLPFVGTSGVGAFVSHAPASGKVLIFFGPHVGISQDGVVGTVERIGKLRPSTSCGAAVGAYKAIEAQKKLGGNGYDEQEEYIIEKLAPKLGGLAALQGGDETITYVTMQMYDIIYELLREQVTRATSRPGFWDKITEVTLFGGIVINRGHGTGTMGGQDFFQPLALKTVTESGEIDMYQEVFGDLKTPRREVS